MKKLIYCALAFAAGLFASSCQQENLEPVAKGNTVTYTVELPDVQTKAIGDGLNVDQLVYEVWKTGEDGVITESSTRLYQKTINLPADAPRKWIVTLNLVQDQTYKALFWAQVGKPEGHENYNTDQLTNVHYAYDVTKNYSSNQESYAAFYGTDVLDTNTPLKGKTITLTRPFAQLNIGTLNTALEDEYAIDMLQSSVEVTVPTQFNVATSEVKNSQKITFNLADVPTDPATLPVSGQTYDYVAMNYVFAGERTVSSVAYTINTKITPAGATEGTLATITNTTPNVPLKENYRTNIVGNLLTSSAKYEVVIDADWAWNEGDTPDWEGNRVEVWNGSEVNEPAKNEDDQYVIEYPSELAWLAAAVNGTLPETKAQVEPKSFVGETFVLSTDLDLNNFEWTPIGNLNNKFQGTFDGGNHVIKNLKITGNNNYVGLFGFTTDGVVKNLTVENANVSGRVGVGVVAGSPYTSKYENITVRGHVEVNGMSYVGGVGGRNAYADWTSITVDTDETSYVNANSVENGTAYRTYVGGVVGFNGEGSHSFKNITSNINVSGSTCDVGGLFGIAHYGNQFENLTCTGNVEITNAEESGEAEQIGGIVGVWMDSDEAAVTFTNVSFEGEVTTNIERETVWYSNLFGKPYNNNGKGKLIVDGFEMVANGVGVKEGQYYVTSAQGLVWVEAQADNFFAGKTIMLANDIDMAGVVIANPIHFWNGRTTFDGQEHTISNLTMTTASTEKKPFSLFTGTADIKNVRFDNANISGYSYVAVVAGNLYGNIDNCHVENSTVTCTYWMAGALSGQYNSGNVTNCTVTNTTVTGPAAVGALVGVINETTGERKIEKCEVTECTVAQNGSFGEDYDSMFGTCVGLINIENSKVYFNECAVSNTKVKGVSSDLLYGSKENSTSVYVNGVNSFVVNTKDELQAAFDNATSGENKIYFAADIKGDVIEYQKADRNILIDGCDKKYDGTIKIHNGSSHNNGTFTIENVAFETSTPELNFIMPNDFGVENGVTRRYSNNVTVQNCTFTATGEAENTAVGIQAKSSKNLKVLDCTSTNLHSLIQAQSCDENVEVTGCTINGKNGVAFKQVKTATVEGTTIEASGYGIRFDGNTDNYGITINGTENANNVTAAQPFIVRRMTGEDNTITLEGNNVLTPTTEGAYQIVITNGEDDADYEIPTGTYTLTGADKFNYYPETPKAKVGNNEYTSIDEAIANWTNNTTLTLLADVTLNDVVKIKSTEHHTLNLGTYTLTAASGKDAIEVTCDGRSSASYALTVNADETNPGGITATGKACIYYKKSDSTKDRPIIRIYNGVFNGSYSINSISNGNTNCPQFWIYGGTFNSNVNLTKNMLQVYGGTFHGWINCTGDQNAYRLIAGGRFKSWQFMTADAPNKFAVSSQMQKDGNGNWIGTYNVGCYVDDEGYLVVGGDPITEFGERFAAKATNPTKWSSYLKYSSAAEHGLYYTNAEVAIKKHGEANVVLK